MNPDPDTGNYITACVLAVMIKYEKLNIHILTCIAFTNPNILFQFLNLIKVGMKCNSS